MNYCSENKRKLKQQRAKAKDGYILKQEKGNHVKRRTQMIRQ